MGRKYEKKKKFFNDAFSSAVQSHIGALKKFCISLTGSAWDGEDLFQESMIKAYKGWIKHPCRPLAKAYLFRIASNAWIDGYRKRHVNIDAAAQPEKPTSFYINEEQTDEKLEQAMALLVRQLSPKQRFIFLLIEGFGLSRREAAQLAGCSEGSVRVAYHRAGKKLADAQKLPAVSDQDRTALYIAAFRSQLPEALLILYRQELDKEAAAFRIRNGLSFDVHRAAA